MTTRRGDLEPKLRKRKQDETRQNPRVKTKKTSPNTIEYITVISDDDEIAGPILPQLSRKVLRELRPSGQPIQRRNSTAPISWVGAVGGAGGPAGVPTPFLDNQFYTNITPVSQTHPQNLMPLSSEYLSSWISPSSIPPWS